ncbi:MAG: hypothetical protein KAX05_05825 [Bacteroidales bacterium]|nr:hypothetical protein [Bacteroidales bacterium]
MKEIFEYSDKLIETVTTEHIRDQIKLLDTPDRLIGIKGSRGVGKTTLLLQYIKTGYKNHIPLWLFGFLY